MPAMISICLRRAALAAPIATMLGAAAPMPLPPGDAPVPHRAVYRISLADAAEAAGVSSAEGRMVFEVAGSACEGFTMSQRLVVRLGDGEGGERLLDFRVSTFEAGDGQLFRFVSRTHVGDEVIEEAAGQARRTGKGIEVKLESPEEKTVQLQGAALFPSQHLHAILKAAKSDQRFLAAEIYEGSGKADAADTATAVIGEARQGATGEEPITRGLRHWPVSIAYFNEVARAEQDFGEEVPSYQMSFTLFENGVTKNLVMDYGEYTLAGTLERIEALQAEPCN